MRINSSLALTLLLQASTTSAFQIPGKNTVAITTNKSYTKTKNKLAPVILGTVAASLFPHPKLANAIGIGSRVPLPTTPGGVDIPTVNKRITQTALLFVWTLFIVAALEWNGFEYFRHLACRLRGMGKDDDEMMDVGLARESDWSQYQHLLEPLKEKKKRVGARIKSFFGGLNRKVYTQDKEAMQKANKFFQEKQYEQHHHLVHVSRIKEDHPAYLDSLSKYSSVDRDAEVAHDKSYLDTLSDLKAKKSTWEDYKMMVDTVKKEKRDEVDKLKDEVSNLQSLMQIEQSMYQTSNQALKLTVDAQKQQLQHANFESEESAVKDLKEFDKMASEYEQTVGKEIEMQKAAGIVEDDVKSIVYEL